MRIILLLLLFLGIFSALGCSRAIYGVPAERWQTMTESERQTAIETFNRDETRYAQTREQAKQARHDGERARKEAEFWQKHCRQLEETAPEALKIKCKKITKRRVILP
jgi:hypothetical protein